MQDVEEMLNERLEQSGCPSASKPVAAKGGVESCTSSPSSISEKNRELEMSSPLNESLCARCHPTRIRKKGYVLWTLPSLWCGNAVEEKNHLTKKLEKFDQFSLVFEDAALEFSPNTIWGADLERALEEAHVKPGDSIQIINHGRTPIQLASGEKG
ncbi:hypothetical protein ACFS07_33060 [Undibacterium arcticum]